MFDLHRFNRIETNKKMHFQVGNWKIRAVREAEDPNCVATIPLYHFTVPLPKKKYSDY